MSSTSRAGIGLGGAIRALAGALVVRQVARYSDAWTNLQNRLRLVTDGTDELNRVTEEVFDIATRTRGGLAETADLYSRIARSSEDLGLNQRELLDVTESVNQAIAISGSTSEAANAAIIQLGQGLASGALRGDELRSVLEQTPRLARAIADGMDVPIGALRELGKQGELTADAVINAIKDQADVLQTEFGETVPTAAQGFTILENSIIRAVGQLADSTGAAGGFAGVLIDLAEFIENDFTPGLLIFGDVVAVTFQEFDRVGSEITRNFEGAGIDITEVLDFVGEALLELPLNVLRAFEIVTTEMGGFFAGTLNEVELFANTAQGIFANLFGDEEAVNAAIQERLGLLQEERTIEESLSAARDEIFNNITRQENQLRDAIDERAAARARANAIDLEAGGGDGSGTIPAPDPSELKDAQKLIDSVKTDQEKFNETIQLATSLLEAGAIAQDDYNTVIQRTSIAYSETLPSVKAYNDELEENAKIVEELKSPMDEFNERVTKLDELADSGQLSWAAYARGVQMAREELEKNDPVLVAQNERLERARELMEEVATPQEEFNLRMAELRDLLDSEALSPEQFERLKTAAQTAFEEASIAADPFLQKLQSIGETAGQNIENAFTEFLVDPSKDAFDSMLDSWIDTLQRMAAEALSAQIMQSLFGGTGAGAGAGAGGGLGGLFASALTGAFSTAADGGTFPGGSPVLVGEEGPELIVPGRQSTVIPNDGTMGMMGAAPEVNVPVTVNNITDPTEIVSAIESSGGQKAILNAISQNPEAIRRALN
jgi:tape measure domain-containing protein